MKDKFLARIKAGMESLTKASHKLAEEMYKSTGAKEQGAGRPETEEPVQPQAETRNDDAPASDPSHKHDDAIDARRHAAMGRRARLERAIHAAKPLDHRLLAITGDLESLDQGLRAMVADAARGDLETIAGDVVLERL